MKLSLTLVVFILLATPIYAENMLDRLKSNESINDTICQDGEYPGKNKECNLDLEDINNLTFTDQVWFYKLLIFGALIFALLNKNLIQDSNFIIIIVFVVFLFIALPGTKAEPQEIIYVEEPLEIEEEGVLIVESELNEPVDNILELPKKWFPSHPVIGGLIVIGVLMVVAAYFNQIMDWFESKLN